MNIISIAGFSLVLAVATVGITQAEPSLESSVAKVTPEPQMLLVGGGLKICSSYSQKTCTRKLDQKELAKRHLRTGNQYQVSRSAIQFIKQDSYKVFEGEKHFSLLVKALKSYISEYDDTVVSEKKLSTNIDKLNVLPLSYDEYLDSLSNKQYHFLKQALQAPVEHVNGKVYNEAVFLDISDENSQAIVSHAKAVVQNIARSKGKGISKSSDKQKNKPLVLVMTSSSSDPYDAVSFYLNLFSDASIKTAWLPLEPALLDVLSSDDLSCHDLETIRSEKYEQYRRSEVYPLLAKYQLELCQRPELMDMLIQRADGLFINGGDQTLTLNALVQETAKGRHVSPFLQRIKEQYQSGKLAVMGTSAGTAVQSGGIIDSSIIPMISNGASIVGGYSGASPALVPPSETCQGDTCPESLTSDSLTYNPNGGLGLLPLGTFDTHFSERNRMIRLTRLLLDTRTPLGIGVDENTAYHLTGAPHKLEQAVVGQGHVWRIDVSNAELIQRKDSQSNAVVSMQGVSIEVLLSDEEAFDLEADVLQYALQGLDCEFKDKLGCHATVYQQNLPLVIEVTVSNFKKDGHRILFELATELSLL